MSRLFKPKISMPTPPPIQERPVFEPPSYNPPSGETEKEDTLAEQEKKETVELKKKGKKQTILTGPQGLTTEADVYSPTLLS